MLRSSIARIEFLEQDVGNWLDSLCTKWKQIMNASKYIMHIVITCWIRKCPTNWHWPHGISVVPHLWQPFPRNIIMCAESHDAAACTNILSTRQTRFYQIKWRVTGEKDGKVLTQLTFSSSLPQNFSVVLRISALYLRISALMLPIVC